MFLFIPCLAVTSRHKGLGCVETVSLSLAAEGLWMVRKDPGLVDSPRRAVLTSLGTQSQREGQARVLPAMLLSYSLQRINQLSVAMSPPSWPCLS